MFNTKDTYQRLKDDEKQTEENKEQENITQTGMRLDTRESYKILGDADPQESRVRINSTISQRFIPTLVENDTSRDFKTSCVPESKGFKVRVLDTQGRTFQLTVPSPDFTIGHFKDLLMDPTQTGVPTERQRLIFHGRLLENTKTLEGCGITENAVVHLFARPENSPIPVSTTGSIPVDEPIPPHFPDVPLFPRGVLVSQTLEFDYELMQSSRRVRFLAAFLFLICAMQVMAIIAIMTSAWIHSDRQGHPPDSDSDTSTFEDPAMHRKFTVADYLLLVVNMFGMAVGIVGMRGSQTFEIDIVENYFKGLLFTGVSSMILKFYSIVLTIKKIGDGSYPGLEHNSTSTARINPPGKVPGVGDDNEGDTADIISDALFSATVALLLWVFCFYRALQFRNQVRTSHLRIQTRDAQHQML